jgi:hypothetical protein
MQCGFAHIVKVGWSAGKAMGSGLLCDYAAEERSSAGVCCVRIEVSSTSKSEVGNLFMLEGRIKLAVT